MAVCAITPNTLNQGLKTTHDTLGSSNQQINKLNGCSEKKERKNKN
jgi:hypothetical protein